jgi:hypothetical protein
LHDQIYLISTVERKAFVDDRQRHLPSEIQSHEMEFMAQAFLIGGFEKSWSEVAMNFDCGCDNRTGSGIAIALFLG